MSGAQVSAFPDQRILFDAASGQALQRSQQNALLQAQTQQNMDVTRSNLADADTERVARLSQWMLTESGGDPAKMATLYSQAVADEQQQGRLMNAPTVFPGEAGIRRAAAMGTPSATLGEQRGVSGAVNAINLGSRPSVTSTPGVTTTPGPIEGDAQTRALAVRDGMIKRGMDFETATAFAANALHESSANPNTGPGDRGASRGLFMWQGPRRQAYIEKYGHEPDNAPLDEQLDFVQHELSGSESLAQQRIAAAQGPEEKARIVSRAYLRPKDEGPEMDRRGATARQLASLGRPQQPVAPRGVAARTGGVDVAGPTGTVPGTPPAPGVQPPAQTGQQQQTATTPPQPQPQQPAATLPPDLQTNEMDLTEKDLDVLVPLQKLAATGNRAAAERFQNELQQRQTRNQTRQHQWRTEQRQERQEQALAAERARVAKRDQAKDDRDAVAAGKPIPGDSVNAVNRNILIAGDPASPEYASAYADYSAQKTESGTVFRPDMSMYREPTWKPPGGSGGGGRSYGTPETKDVPTAGDKSKLKEIETQGSSILAALETFRKTRTEAGGIERIATAMGVPTELATTYGNAALLAKGVALYELGVLNGPDLEILQRVLADPSTVSGGLVSSETVNKQVDQVKTLLETKISKAREQYGGAKPEAKEPPRIEPPPGDAAPVTVKSLEDAQNLKPGTVYLTPDGRRFKR